MPPRPISRCFTGVAAAAALLLAHQALGQPQRESGERLIRNQEQRWNISCKEIHPRAHKFVAEYVPRLLITAIDGPEPLRNRYASLATEASELSDQTLKCYGIEPIAINTGIPFESDFGELHEVLRTAHELIESITSEKHEVLRNHYRGELQKRYDELRSGTGRRYRTRP